MAKRPPTRLALVLSGGGARGAYEAGIIHYIRTQLPQPYRDRPIDIHAGSSVGSINSCFTVATANDMAFQGREIRRLWEEVREDNIYQRNLKALAGFVTKSSTQFLWKFLKGDTKSAAHFPGFLDTKPFIPFISKVIPWKQLTRNINQGLIQALSIVVTNLFTGRMELFIQKHPDAEYNGEHVTHFTRIIPEHARASAAIPIIFPAVMVGGIAYTDGGLRLNTPLSPAIHLGADRILAIGLNHRAGPGEKIPSRGRAGEPPALGLVIGRVMNAMFLDKIQTDLEQVERINRIIEWGEAVCGPEFLPKINQMLHREEHRGDIADRGLKKLQVLRIRPSVDIGELFRRTFRGRNRQRFTAFEKFIVRIMDVDPNSGVDLLSYISFLPQYLKKLLALGYDDARAHRDRLMDFFDG